MTQGERLKAVRKELKLSQEKFGEKLGVEKSAISQLEGDRNKLTGQMIRSICREYKVRYDWLVYGDGEMFEDLSGVMDKLCIEYDCDEMDRKILEYYLTMGAEKKAALKCFLGKFLSC